MDVRTALEASPIRSARYERPGYCLAITDAGLSLLLLTLGEDHRIATWFHASLDGDLHVITLFAQSHDPDFDPLGWMSVQCREEIEQYPNWLRPPVPSPSCSTRSRYRRTRSRCHSRL
jgi:hypothetical protein